MIPFRYNRTLVVAAAAALVCGFSAAQESTYPRVVGISATAGGPSTFVMLPENAPKRELVTSNSVIVQGVLIPALLSEAGVTYELVPGSNSIKRVQPYEVKDKSPIRLDGGRYYVSRIATQRNPETGQDHLEVFLKENKTPPVDEKAYNVRDPMLQQLLLAVFLPQEHGPVGPHDRITFDAEFDGNYIATVFVGEHPKDRSKYEVGSDE